MSSALNTKLRLLRTAGPVALTLCLLGAALADKVVFHLPPADAAPYHAHVKQVSETLPYTIGRWIGSDTPVPESAVKLLHPNALLSRQYRDVVSGRTVSLLVVQVKDARDLIGHYPPVCYVAHGWTKQDARPIERKAGGAAIPATYYRFTSARIDRATELRIDNFMVLPGGGMCRDMDGVEQTAQDYRRKFFGAAQVQVITDDNWTDADREDVFRQLIEAAEPLLSAIRSGVTE